MYVTLADLAGLRAREWCTAFALLTWMGRLDLWAYGRTLGQRTYAVSLPRVTATCHPQDLEEKFSRYGRVTEARVVRHPSTRESRGFAFVVMSNEREAEEVGRVAGGLRPGMRGCSEGQQAKKVGLGRGLQAGAGARFRGSKRYQRLSQGARVMNSERESGRRRRWGRSLWGCGTGNETAPVRGSWRRR